MPAEDGVEPGFRFVRGPIRLGLRYALLVVLAVGLSVVILSELSEGIVGLSAYVPGFDGRVDPLFVVAGIAWVGLQAIPLHRIEAVPTRRITGVLGLYGLVAVLWAGTALSVLMATVPSLVPILEAPPNDALGLALYGSGVLLLTLLGGLRVSDLTVRLECLFARLTEKDPAVVEGPANENGSPDADSLEGFGTALDASVDVPIGRHRTVTVPVAHLFAGFVLLPFVLGRLVQFGGGIGGAAGGLAPIGVIDVLGALVPTVLKVFLVVVFFQFLVFVGYFNRVLTEHSLKFIDGPVRSVLVYIPGAPGRLCGLQRRRPAGDPGQYAPRPGGPLPPVATVRARDGNARGRWSRREFASAPEL